MLVLNTWGILLMRFFELFLLLSFVLLPLMATPRDSSIERNSEF